MGSRIIFLLSRTVIAVGLFSTVDLETVSSFVSSVYRELKAKIFSKIHGREGEWWENQIEMFLHAGEARFRLDTYAPSHVPWSLIPIPYKFVF